VPTARELLEQADALMRRNRPGTEDDIPVLTDAVPSMQEAKSRFAPTPRSNPHVPVPHEEPGSAPAPGDDVPLLTDEVEEIEAAPLQPEVGEGEPSVWLEFAESEPSVIGDAPDSIAMVPSLDLPHAQPLAEVHEFDGLDEELAAAIAAAPREDETLLPEPPAAIIAPPEPAAPSIAATGSPGEAIIFSGGAAALLHGGVVPDTLIGEPVLPAELVRRELVAEPVVTEPISPGLEPAEEVVPEPAAPARAESERVTQAEWVTTPASQAEVAPPAIDDPAKWDAMAEEIRMQVLQRIDLFTDTGLRTQLGERLQPIVDRASADLVATINQHVGELLRAYVAEAIEREIDSWRRNH
jgi:hypothetical protein